MPLPLSPLQSIFHHTHAMKAIFLLASRGRFHIPRVGEFINAPQFEPFCGGYRPFIYQGRAFGPDEIEEANLASSRILDTVIPNLGHQVTVRFLTDEQYEAATAQPEFPEPEQTPEQTPEDKPAAPVFTLKGRSIMIGDERVAMLYGPANDLRVFKDELRDAVKEWLDSQSQAPSGNA